MVNFAENEPLFKEKQPSFAIIILYKKGMADAHPLDSGNNATFI